jgi:tetratricopeptide (TPR) repeat protein
MGHQKLLLLWIVLFVGVLAGGPALGITPYDDVLVGQALKNLQQENYEEALVQLTEAWQKGVHTPEKAFYMGVVYRRLLNYPKAQQFLEEALRLRPNYLEARSLLADTLLALERLDQALPHLKELERAGYQPAQTAMLLGVVATKQKRYQEAVAYFQKAQADPALAQEAKFQLGLALAAQNRLQEAQKTLKETINLAPKTITAGFAERYAALLERRIKELRPLRFYGWAGVDYDSNVTLQPGDPTSAQLVSGQGDAVYTYSGYLEYNFFNPAGAFGLLGQYAFYQNFHPRLTKFDMVSHTIGMTPTYQFKQSRLWLPFNYAFVDVENDKYYTAFTVTPTYLYLLTPKVGLEVGGRLARKYYWFPLGIPQDDRSAKNIGSGLGLYYFLKNQEGYLLARFSYEHDFAAGSNWDSSSYRLFLMALYPATARLKLSAFTDMILQPYNHRFFGGVPLTLGDKRDDKIFIFGVNVAYEIYKGIEANLHYYFIRDDSNIALYDYSRHIVGCQLGYRY